MRRRIDVMADVKKLIDEKIIIDHKINDLNDELETLPIDMHEEFETDPLPEDAPKKEPKVFKSK